MEDLGKPKDTTYFLMASLDELNPGVAIDLADKLTKPLPASKHLQRPEKTKKAGK